MSSRRGRRQTPLPLHQATQGEGESCDSHQSPPDNTQRPQKNDCSSIPSLFSLARSQLSSSPPPQHGHETKEKTFITTPMWRVKFKGKARQHDLTSTGEPLPSFVSYGLPSLYITGVAFSQQEQSEAETSLTVPLRMH